MISRNDQVHYLAGSLCCILTFERAVNQGLRRQDVPAVWTGRQWCMGVSNWHGLTNGSWSGGLKTGTHGRWELYIHIRRSGSWSHNQVKAESVLSATGGWRDSSLSAPRQRSRKSFKWGSEYEINVVKKVWIYIAMLRQSVCLSLTAVSMRRKNKETYVYNQVL